VLSPATHFNQPGCRSLTVVYAGPATVAPLAGVTGAYPGQVRELAYTAYNPDATPAAMATVLTAVYNYDSTGRLVSSYDPRQDVTANQHLVTTYGYTGNQLTVLTPPGEAAWNFTYDGVGRLSSVWRANTTTSTTRYVYDVTLSGNGTGLPDLTTDAAGVTSWGQPTDDAPTTAVAVFPPDHQPSGSPGTSDWQYADLTYLDTLGRATNTAAYGDNGDGTSGWQIDTTVYGEAGRVVSTLTARNRQLALASPCPAAVPSAACAQPSTIRAQLLSTLTVYGDQTPNWDPQDGPDPAIVTDTYGPATTATPATAAGPVSERLHTHTSYDENAPTSTTGEPWRLPTTVTTSAYYLDGLTPPTALFVAGADTDAHTTTNGYDPIDGKSQTDPTSGWILGKPTVVTLDPGTGHLAITSPTRYDAYGNVVESRQPASNGSDAGTTLTRYYSALADSGDSRCDTKPEWAGEQCTSGPAAQPAGTTIPASYTQKYSMLLQPETVVETSGTTSRTTTSSYDNVGRVKSISINVNNPPAGEQAVPDRTFGYDPATGLPTTTSMNGKTITTGYDSEGRPTSYDDSNGNTATTSYDIDGRPQHLTDSKGSVTYTYDSSTEHRGLVTSYDAAIGNNIPSVTTIGYDTAGTPVKQTFPNGVTETGTNDPTGNAGTLTYKASDGTILANWNVQRDEYGRIIDEFGPSATSGRDQTFAYDAAGRLTSTNDTLAASCTVRSYTYDPNSNRKTQSSWGGRNDQICPTATTSINTTGRTAAYDPADRITTATPTGGTAGSYSYDTLGRVTTVPATSPPAKPKAAPHEPSTSTQRSGSTAGPTPPAAARPAPPTITTTRATAPSGPTTTPAGPATSPTPTATCNSPPPATAAPAHPALQPSTSSTPTATSPAPSPTPPTSPRAALAATTTPANSANPSPRTRPATTGSARSAAPPTSPPDSSRWASGCTARSAAGSSKPTPSPVDPLTHTTTSTKTPSTSLT
jgi:YD repeat-containing protein